MMLALIAVGLVGAGVQQGGRVPAKPTMVRPVLAFPEPGIDDTASYQGYQTRFYRDSKNNTVQIYIQPQTARVVLVWADAADESAGFSVRDAGGRPPRVTWGAESSNISDSGTTRSIEYQLTADVSRIQLGWFVLGSMRVERDFVYAKRYQAPFTSPAFRVAEESLLVAALTRLPKDERKEHLALLRAQDTEALRARLEPTLTAIRTDSGTIVRVVRPSLDGRNTIAIELRVDPRKTRLGITGRTVSISTRPGSSVQVRVRVTTDAAALTPLSRDQIFNRDFLQFVERAGTDTTPDAALRHRRLERQVLGVELLSSQEKLMAGLPNFATYFGRDMMMTALMMRPIWTAEMSEHVIASVLRKLGPHGEVSHEEALGGQAIREHASIYDSLLNYYRRAARLGRREESDTILRQARDVLQELQRTRENYHMIDDEFHLPVLVGRYLADPGISSQRKRRFLLESEPEGARLALILRELGLVASLAHPYALEPRAANLVSFPKLDASRWRSASWRDSDAGYAGGRFAMDINAIWVPTALSAIANTLRALTALGFDSVTVESLMPDSGQSPLREYKRNPQAMQHAIETWSGARKHFEVTLSPADIGQRVRAKLSWLPAMERRYWQKVMADDKEPTDSLTFLALSLDGRGRPIPVVNTDLATGLFLTDTLDQITLAEDIAPFRRPFPVGLFVEGLGPVVANDAYASRAIWDRFEEDQYHGPRVVWGREVNLLLLGLAKQMSAGSEASQPTEAPPRATLRNELKETLRGTLSAVNASGLQHNELWSYEVRGGKLVPRRYGTSSDLQLWNTTNLVVQYELSRLPALSR
jgi:hypothetical protein